MVHGLEGNSCANSMQGVKDTIGSGRFNVNELLAMLRLLRYVCSHRDAELVRLGKRAQARGQVMVPDSDCCLVPTSACVHTHNCPPQLLARSATHPAHRCKGHVSIPAWALCNSDLWIGSKRSPSCTGRNTACGCFSVVTLSASDPASLVWLLRLV